LSISGWTRRGLAKRRLLCSIARQISGCAIYLFDSEIDCLARENAMLRFDANLTTLYGNLPLLQALGAAKADGFAAVECRSPFSEPKEKVAEALAELGLEMVQFNCPMGDFAAGDRGIACVPGREDEFRESIAQTIDYAKALGVTQVNCVAGLRLPGAGDGEIEDVFVANLKFAAPRLAEAGIRLQIEPINPFDTPGVFFATMDQFERVRERVGSDNLFL